MTITTIALFGATGNVGKALIQVLKDKTAEKDYQFLVFSRSAAFFARRPYPWSKAMTEIVVSIHKF